MRTLRQRESFLEHHRPMAARGDGPKLFESATITCAHCNTVVVLNPDRSRPRGYCRKCDAYVCDNPLCNNDCNGSFSKVLDDLEKEILRAERNQTTLVIPDIWSK